MSRRQMSSYGQIKICFSLNFRKQWKVKLCVKEETIWKLILFSCLKVLSNENQEVSKPESIDRYWKVVLPPGLFFIYFKETSPQEEYKTGFVIYRTIE
jgi:hypothetical protein